MTQLMLEKETVQIAGEKVVVVNRLPQETMDKVVEVMSAFKWEDSWDRWNKVDNIIKFIAGGYCGRVYDLGEYVLKISIGREGITTRDGIVLHELQGAPAIPKIYLYSEDSTFMVIQKIKGKTVNQLELDRKFIPNSWNIEEQKELLCKAHEEIAKRGWVMADCHGDNCMVDEEGKFWIVDVGIFHRTTDSRWGRGYLTAKRTLSEANDHIEDNLRTKNRIEKAKKDTQENRAQLYQVKTFVHKRKTIENTFMKALENAFVTPIVHAKTPAHYFTPDDSETFTYSISSTYLSYSMTPELLY